MRQNDFPLIEGSVGKWKAARSIRATRPYAPVAKDGMLNRV